MSSSRPLYLLAPFISQKTRLLFVKILLLKKLSLSIVDTSLLWTLLESPKGVHYREVLLYFGRNLFFLSDPAVETITIRRRIKVCIQRRSRSEYEEEILDSTAKFTYALSCSEKTIQNSRYSIGRVLLFLSKMFSRPYQPFGEKKILSKKSGWISIWHPTEYM